MREDARVTYVILVSTVVAYSLSLLASFRSGADSPNWELRWRSLEPQDSARISTAARGHKKLTDRAEEELAAGLRRRDRRRDGYVELALLSFPLAAAVLSLAGVLDSGVVSFVFACFGIAGGLWAYLRGRFMDGTPRPVTTPDAGL
jgi:hypothetical protein